MKRRHFLAFAGGLAGFSGPTRPAAGAALPHDCPGWSKVLPETGDEYPSTQPPIPKLPPQTGAATSFQPVTKILPRLPWSKLDPHKNRRVIQDVRDGYCRMRSLPMDDPRSLIRQVWLHDYYCGTAPDGTDVHHTWAFLPWHRAFLYYHEQILGSLIGNSDFRLPYWDWDRQGTTPAFFLDLGLPDFLIQSAGRLNPGPGASWADSCVLQAWLLSDSFTAFAGSEDVNGPPGLAVNGPHGMAHAFVGGAMRNPATAAADPIFFAHHGNVDRFWSYWQKQYQCKPPNDDWGRQEFFFHDAHSRLVRVKASDVADIRQLGYSYDQPTVPLCPFEAVSIQLADFVNPFRLKALLKNLTLAGLIATGNLALQKPGEFLNSAIKYSDLLRPECFLAFPIQTSLTLPGADLKAGDYYVVGLVRDKFYKIGGFGVFASKLHLSMEKEVRLIATGCLDPELYAVLLKNPVGFELKYGKSSDGTNPDVTALHSIDPANWLIKLLYPKGYVDSAKDLLKNFGIP